MAHVYIVETDLPTDCLAGSILREGCVYPFFFKSLREKHTEAGLLQTLTGCAKHFSPSFSVTF